ncbi:hypothetical protein [Mesorhizobium koreense]|jgi:hypothetical protein|uniref:hypothetical protein n=1 Tax=Mesorhizobium koreense TaxID=3074855 RepID=UPI00287BBF0A|nr:hypothetical protein [Mesorhizobium sp. WR6]
MLVECANGVVEIPDLEHELKFMQNEESIRIDFPDHIREEFEMAGIVVPIKDLLYWFGDGFSPEYQLKAQKLREIADRYYGIPDDGVDILGDPNLIEDIETAVNEFWPKNTALTPGNDSRAAICRKSVTDPLGCQISSAGYTGTISFQCIT